MAATASMGALSNHVRATSSADAAESLFGQVISGEGSCVACLGRACADPGVIPGVIGHIWPRWGANARGGRFPRREESQ